MSLYPLTLDISLTPPAGVSTSLSARSNALSIRLEPPWHCRRPTRLLTSSPFRRLPVNVLNLRTTLALVLYGIRAIRPPDGDTLKKVTKVWTNFCTRFQLPRSSHAEESMMKVVSIGIGQTSSVRQNVEYKNYSTMYNCTDS